MAYAERYNIRFLNVDNYIYEISIYEDGYVGDVTSLTGADQPAVIQMVDNEELAYPPIQKTDLTIKFISESNFSLSELFIAGGVSDITYKVEYKIITGGERLLWTGFLDTESCYEDIVDDPREVTLRAVDGLGFLKGAAFLDDDGIRPYGKFTLLQCIEWCLRETSLEIPLHIFVSVFEETMDDRDADPANEPFSQCKIHTRMWEEANAYEVIEAICRSFAATLYQANGTWVIERKHDRWNDRLHMGTAIDYPYTTEIPTAIGYHFVHTSFTPINADHIRTLIPPNSLTSTTYNYVAAEIPRNKNFEGDFLAPVSGPDNTANEIAHWTYEYDAVSSPLPATATPYRNVVFDTTTRKVTDSYIVLPRNTATATDDERLISEGIEVSVNDKVTLTMEHRFKFDVSGSGTTSAASIILYGNSGQKYTLDDNTLDINQQATWTPTLTSSVGQIILRSYGSGDDLTEWQTITVQAQGFPEDGTLALWLWEGTPSVTGNETWYRNVRFTLALFVNDQIGISGEQAIITQTAVYRGSTENLITIGDAPKKTINGALWRGSDDTELTTLWHIQGMEDEKPLITLTNRAFFQLYCRFKTKVEGTIDTIEYAHPAGGNTIVQPNIEMIYAPSTMEGIRYIPTNLTILPAESQAQVFLIEFYNDDEEADPLGDLEVLKYLYQ